MAENTSESESRFDIHKFQVWFPIIAASIAGIWAIYSFLYQENLRIEESTTYLVIESKLENKGLRGDLVAIQATINITNPSNTKAFVLADYFNVHGAKVGSSDVSDEEYQQSAIRSLENKSYLYLSRFTKIEEYRIVFSGKVFDWPDVWWLEPNESLTAERIFYIPKSFDFLKMTSPLYYCKDEDFIEGVPQIDPTDFSISHKITIKESGEDFDWENSEHLALQKIHRNAEISHETHLVL